MRFHINAARRLRASVGVLGAGVVVVCGALLPITASSASAGPTSTLGGLSAASGDTTTAALTSGSIQHVWLIILENKSYNSEFSGVNGDTYLWQTLPSEGALLKNYYGTGHTSMDNYITMVSGQAPQYDVQSDCSNANTQFASNTGVAASTTSSGLYNGGLGGIVDATDTSANNAGGATGTSAGGDTQNWFYGQAVSSLGPNAPIGSTTATNGCTYPTNVATVFDQFNQAGVTWKGYAQDLGGSQLTGSTSFVSAGSGATANEPASWSGTVPTRDAGACGAPGNPNETAENPVSNPTFLSGTEGYPVASNVVSSTVTSSTTTTLTDTTQTFTSSEVGDEVIITGGSAINEKGTIASVSGSTLTLSGSGFSKVPGASSVIAPPAGSSYVVGLADTTSYTAASLVAGTGSDAAGTYSANNPEYSDQYVAKHFPFAWFESLSGVTGSSTTTPLTTPANGGTNCDANHVANLDSPQYGLVHDLQANTVPNFSWITPDNCSDGHDASCKGNNLSGAFGLNSDGTINLNDPIYTPSSTSGANCTPNCSQIPSYDPEATTPRNFTGGTYSADLFLAYYIPLIEQSTADQHGLIDVTFDEGEPSFVYGGNTFNNIPTTGPTSTCTTGSNTNQYNGSGGCYPAAGTGTQGPSGTGPEDNGSTPVTYPSTPATAPADTLTYGPGGQYPGADSQFGADDLFADSAGETVGGTAKTSEPDGPNSPLVTDSNGNQVDYGPGFNLDIDRPVACSGSVTTNCVTGENLGDGGNTSSATRSDTVTNSAQTIADNSVVADDTGREIVSAIVGGNTVTVGTTAYDTAFGISAGDAVYVGEVSQTGPAKPTTSGGSTLLQGSFQLTDDSGSAVVPTGAVTKLTLSGECDPAADNLASTCSANQTPDPLFDASDPTTGGGDTGSVLISPYITPGTVSTVDYNHYSWLRTMEDLFDVSSCTAANSGSSSTDVTLTAGTVCGGEDGQGHLGYAAQTNLDDFGSDVFTAPAGNGYVGPPASTPESPMAIALPAIGLVMLGGFVVMRRRSQKVAAS